MLLDWLRLFLQNFRAVRAARREAESAQNAIEVLRASNASRRADLDKRQAELDAQCLELTNLRQKQLEQELERVAVTYAYKHRLQVKDVQVELDYGGRLFVLVTDKQGQQSRKSLGVLESARPN
jgi:hypothetical protein